LKFSEIVDILETIKEDLIEKYEEGDESIKRKIKALRSIIKFVQIMFRSFPKGFIKKILIEDTEKNNDAMKKIITQYNSNKEMCTRENDGNDIDIIEDLYNGEIKLMINHKMEYKIIKYKGQKYIMIEPQKYNKNTLQWNNWENFIFPKEILQENRKRIKEINIK
jgi:hypothetical protein